MLEFDADVQTLSITETPESPVFPVDGDGTVFRAASRAGSGRGRKATRVRSNLHGSPKNQRPCPFESPHRGISRLLGIW